VLRGLSSGVDTHGRVSGRADTERQAILARQGGARPGPRKVFRAMALQDSAASVPVAAGEQTIRANVSVTYDLE